MTNEERQLLKKFESFLDAAKNKGYIHGISTAQAKELFEIAEHLHVRSGNPSCPKCILDTAKAVANLYYTEPEPVKPEPEPETKQEKTKQTSKNKQKKNEKQTK